MKGPGRPLVALDPSGTHAPLENQAFEFFRGKTASYLAGYFTDGIYDKLLLRISHNEPSVRLALNALGSLHWEKDLRTRAVRDTKSPTTSSSSLELHTTLPVSQYSKALEGLRQCIEQKTAPLDVVLACSLLFIQFEVLRESVEAALAHLDNVMRLLRSNHHEVGKKMDSVLVGALMRLDLNATSVP